MNLPDIPRPAPSDWIVRWSHLVPAGGSVLDVACGTGRHMRWFHEHGHPVTGIDRAPEALDAAALFGDTVRADIENGPWPFSDASTASAALEASGVPGAPGQRFDAVVVTNYLWRPRLADIVASVAPGGVLLYETFAAGNETVGKPSRPDFLLQPGELLRVCATLQIIAFEDGWLDAPSRFVQRIAAVRPRDTDSGVPRRHALQRATPEAITGPDERPDASQ